MIVDPSSLAVEPCGHCGKPVARGKPGTVQVNVVRADQLPLGAGKLDFVIFSAHLTCLVQRMAPGFKSGLSEWPLS